MPQRWEAADQDGQNDALWELIPNPHTGRLALRAGWRLLVERASSPEDQGEPLARDP